MRARGRQTHAAMLMLRYVCLSFGQRTSFAEWSEFDAWPKHNFCTLGLMMKRLAIEFLGPGHSVDFDGPRILRTTHCS